MDLKKNDRGISVAAVAPGFVATDLGGSKAKMEQWGAKPVRQATSGILSTIDAMSVENTGRFMMVPTDGSEPKEFPW